MKFFVTFVALVAVAIASPVVKPVNSDIEVMEAIVAAISSPNTDPATAHLLEQQLQDILGGANLTPISVGPAIVEPEPVFNPEPIAVGPALVDIPHPDGGAITNPIVPSPVVVGPIPDGSPSPLVQIIVNINQVESSPVPVGPIVAPTPVQVVDTAPIPVDPVHVVEVAPEPVQVVEVAPLPAEPVIIGTPILPSPAITLPEELN